MAWARVSLALCGVSAVAGCARPGGTGGQPVAAEVTSASASLAVARAAGEQLRLENGRGFVVLPTFKDKNSETPGLSDTESAESRRRLLDAFRTAAAAQWADTVAYKDLTRGRQLPDSARYYYTLAVVPLVRSDSASVDVYGGRVVFENVPVELTVCRYVFLWRDDHWQFVRRVLLYGA